MFVTAVVTLLCAAGVGFYVRFLIALSKERKPRLGGHWMRLQLASGGNAIEKSRQRNESMTRAA